MSDTERLDPRRETEHACLRPTQAERPEAMFTNMAAERAAIARFGRGAHLQACRALYGEGSER